MYKRQPHAPYGPIALAATLQVDVCSPNVFIQEQSLGIHYNKGFDLLDFVKNKDVFQYENGFVKVPTLPGLGLEIDEEKVKDCLLYTSAHPRDLYHRLSQGGVHA